MSKRPSLHSPSLRSGTRLRCEQLEDRDVPAAGVIDLDFGTNGIAQIGDLTDSHTAMQADGKLVSAGTGSHDFQVARLNVDGSIDVSFGSGGRVSTDFKRGQDVPSAVAIQSDGKILVAGSATVSIKGGTTQQNALVRYNANGTIDNSFGTKGEVLTASTGGINDMALLPGGQFYTVGTSGTTGNIDLVVCRYKANGSLDSSFGTGGKVVVDFFGKWDGGRSLAVQTDGKVLVSGWVQQLNDTGRTASAVMIRLNSNGSLDGSFGSGGKVFPGAFEALANFVANPSLALSTNGQIILGGTTLDGMDFLLAQFNPDGTIDTGFGTNGFTQTDFGGGIDWIRSVTVDSSDRIVVAGETSNTDPATLAMFAVARYTSDGFLDTSFGVNGLTSYQNPDPQFGGYNTSVTILPDGSIIATGTSNSTTFICHISGD